MQADEIRLVEQLKSEGKLSILAFKFQLTDVNLIVKNRNQL
jgi:hypothetical protein